MRRLYNRFFSLARRERKKAILKDFEEELVDRTHRSFLNHIRRRIVIQSAFVSLFIFVIGSISPNFFSSDPSYPLASAEFEEDYAQSILLSIDGFLTKTYTPTEESKSASGIFTIEVVAGDTLSTIAERYGVTVRDLMVNNNLPANPLLRIGQKLVVASGIIHQVQKNETFESIAKAYGVERDKILASNGLVEKDLKAGMEIVIRGAKANIVNPSRLSPSRYPSLAKGKTTPSTFIASSSIGKLLFPTIGKYTQYFRPGHYAVDIGNNQSPDVLAAEVGVIEVAECGWNGGYGCHVIIDHGDGVKTLYAHLRKIYVTVGEQVGRGQSIAQMGNTGRVYGRTGIHLHFEVIINGVKRNPLAFF